MGTPLTSPHAKAKSFAKWTRRHLASGILNAMTIYSFKDEEGFQEALERAYELPSGRRQPVPGRFLLYWDLGPQVTMRQLRVAQSQMSGLMRAVVRYELLDAPGWGTYERHFGSRSAIASSDNALVVQSGGYSNPWWEEFMVFAQAGGVGAGVFAAMRSVKYLLGVISDVATLGTTIRARRQRLEVEIAQGQLEQLRSVAELSEFYGSMPRQITPSQSRTSTPRDEIETASPADAPHDLEIERARAASQLLDRAARIERSIHGSLPELEYVRQSDTAEVPGLEGAAAAKAARRIQELRRP